ncbi:hypothetical protein PybrP1_006036 [[Pythium] brassicae (nom. inval.)]|nr:hypothetical protein PybrP1_006036 [[Pythium] brassicae (nom. inval.)]
MLDEHPVDEHDVPRITISAHKLEQWREVASTEVARAVSERSSWYFQLHERARREGYESIVDRDNLKGYARSLPNSPHKTVLIRASLETTLDAIVYGLYCETTREQRCSFAHLYEDHFLDGAVLHVGQTRSREDPFRFVGVKWSAFRSPAPAFLASRDFIFFSYSGTTRDADGQRVLFRLLRSMPMDGVEVTERRNNNLVRGKISYLFLYRENGARTEVSVQALHALAGGLPSWVVTKTISFVFPAITNLVTVAEAKVLMATGVTGLHHAGSVYSSSSSNSGSGAAASSSAATSSFFARAKAASASNSGPCGVCYRRLRVMRSKRTCRGCQRCACKSCTVKLCFLDERKEQSDTGVMPLRFCLNCMVKARAERLEATAHMFREDSVATDLDDDFSELNVSIYRETLRRTRYLDELSDEDDDDAVDVDDLDDVAAHEAANYTSRQLPSHQRLAGSPPRKRRDEPQYAAGESFEGTSLMSSNMSILSSNPSFVSSVSSSGDGSLPFSLSSSAIAGLSGRPGSRHNSSSDTQQFGSSRGLRSRHQSSSSSNGGTGALRRVGSMTPQEADDLEKTFRLRMLLFPDESTGARKANGVAYSQEQAPERRAHR